MLITIRELKTYISVSDLLLSEALNVAAMANRGLATRGLVTQASAKSTESIVAVSAKQTEFYKSYGGEIPKVLGAAVSTQDLLGRRLNTLYADDATTAVMLLAASFEKWEWVVPDQSVSPAARQLLKRYFEEFKDDASKIQLGADTKRKDPNDPDFLRAAYLGPVGFELNRAVQTGEAAVIATIEPEDLSKEEIANVKDWVTNRAKKGFSEAYGDDARTKIPKERTEE